MDEDDAIQAPEPVREFAQGVMAGDEFSYLFEDAVVDVPSRFDRESPTARWRFDGRITVRVRDPGE